MTTLVWMDFSLYLNYISHPTILTTSRLRKMRMRNQTKFRYLFFRIDTFLFLWVFQCVFCSLFIFRNLLLFIHISVHFILFIFSSASSCALLISSFSLQASSWSWRYSSLSWVLLIVSSWRNTSSNPSVVSFITRKAAESCGFLFFSGWDQRASLR